MFFLSMYAVKKKCGGPKIERKECFFDRLDYDKVMAAYKGLVWQPVTASTRNQQTVGRMSWCSIKLQFSVSSRPRAKKKGMCRELGISGHCVRTLKI
jgi:hypothetical protein